MHCWPRYFLWILIAILGLGNLLTACGQRGPLYLPEPETEQQEKGRASADSTVK